MFAGGATAEAALRVGGLGEATLDVLTALVEKSLLVAVPGDPSRYRMLETIREYAARRLDEAGEQPAVEAAHTALVVELVETAEPRLRRTDQLEWVARLRAETDDVAAVLRRAVAAGDAATAQRLVAASAWFWLIRGLFTEATDRLTEAGALDGPVPPPARALCTAYRAMAAAGDGDFTAASALLADAERFVTGLPADRHPVLLLMGPVAAGFGHGDPVPLERLLADPHADAWARAFALFTRAQMAENEGDLDRQRADMRAAHEMFAALGDRWGLGMTLSSLGDLESVAGEHDAGIRAFDEAIALAVELGNDDDLPQFRAERARLLVRRGEIAAGRAALRRIVALPGLHPEQIGVLRGYLADAARRAGDLDDARTELALAQAQGHPGPGALQRRALQAALGSAIARAAGDRAASAELLAEAVAAATESRDGPVTAAVAEMAAAHVLADDPATAAALLGVGAAQRGASDLGDPEVRATITAVRAALGQAAADAAVAHARGLARSDGVALLQDYARGAGSGSATAVLGLGDEPGVPRPGREQQQPRAEERRHPGEPVQRDQVEQEQLGDGGADQDESGHPKRGPTDPAGEQDQRHDHPRDRHHRMARNEAGARRRHQECERDHEPGGAVQPDQPDGCPQPRRSGVGTRARRPAPSRRARPLRRRAPGPTSPRQPPAPTAAR